jgi:hypothetical protein
MKSLTRLRDGVADARYRRIRNVAILMDGAMRMPGTRFRLGLGSLIGLPPVAGDTLLTAISLWIVWEAQKLGLPRAKIVRMLGNIAIETALGSVPVLGDVMDVVWKANLRNLAIIDEYLTSGAAATDDIDGQVLRIISAG